MSQQISQICHVEPESAWWLGQRDILKKSQALHRITEWLRLEETSGCHLVQPSAQAQTPRAGFSGPRPGGFEHLQGGSTF